MYNCGILVLAVPYCSPKRLQHNLSPMEGLNGGVMTVTGERFEIQTVSGLVLKGKLKRDASKSPAEMDMTYDSGLLWEAVYEVNGVTFNLNYATAGTKDRRRENFLRSEDTEVSLIIMKRTKQ